jgi:hypothetical protein
MSGIIVASAADASCYKVDIVTAAGGGGLATVIGYVQGSLGSMSPTTMFGVNFGRCAAAGFGPYVWLIRADGAMPQNFFSSILVPIEGGTYAQLMSSACNFSPGGPDTQWSWDTGGVKYWTGVGVTKSIIIRK